jgi:hypothetical protein
MPFTVSHIAAVLPLKRLPLCFPALVIGAMSPDFTYVIEVFGPSIEAHSIYGILYFCLPVSWLVLFVYKSFLRYAWEKLFPWLNGESRPYGWYVIPLSIILGAATHVVWDSFTHRHGYAVIHINALQWMLFRVGTYPVTVFKILQHGSTVGGGFAVAVGIYRAARRSDQRKFVTSKPTLAALVIATFFVTLLISFQFLLSLEAQFHMPHGLLVMRMAIRLLAALVVVTITYPFSVWVQRKTGGNPCR